MGIEYYDRFSKVYDVLSPKSYYHKPRQYAIKQIDLKNDQTILNIPCGTGQNFEYFQAYLKGSGSIVGIDLSEGMLEKAEKKMCKQEWNNITLIKENVLKIDREWVDSQFQEGHRFDAVFCDLGLSGFPEWETVIDNLLEVLKPGGVFVIMDWYMEQESLRGKFIKWIGKGEVTRPLYQYLRNRVVNFDVNKDFKNGEMFVATGYK